MTDTRTFPGVEYEKWAARVHFFLGELETGLPQDPAARKFISSWAAAMLERDWHSRALVFTWDLDARNPSCLLRADSGPDPRLPPSLDYRRAPERDFDPDNMGRWVLVKFHHDPDKLQASGWSLLTSAMGALLLARRLSEADPSRVALSTLVAVGVPVHTGTLRVVVPHPSDSASKPGRASESDLRRLLGHGSTTTPAESVARERGAGQPSRTATRTASVCWSSRTGRTRARRGSRAALCGGLCSR